MSSPDVDEIINYLSIKFNKIFCDREFVSCVLQDFQIVLCDKNKCCVLVFPALEPLYQKAVRYQAKIFDLAVFTIACGKFRSVAVCHKDHLLKKSQEQEPSETMREDSKTETSMSSRRKRPERQLYVPPAQRRSLISHQESMEDTTAKLTRPKNKSTCGSSKTKNQPQNTKCDVKNQECNNNIQSRYKSSQICISNDTCQENRHKSKRIYFSDIIDVFENRFITKNMYKLIDISYSEFNVQLYDTSGLETSYYRQPWKILDQLEAVPRYSESEISFGVPFYKCTSNPCSLFILKTYFVNWQPELLCNFTSDIICSDSGYRTFPLFDFYIYEEHLMDYTALKVPVIISNSIDPLTYESVMTSFKEVDIDNTALRILCDGDFLNLEFDFLNKPSPVEEEAKVGCVGKVNNNQSATVKRVVVSPNNDNKRVEKAEEHKEKPKELVIVLPESRVEPVSQPGRVEAVSQPVRVESVSQPNNKDILKNKLNSSREKNGSSIKVNMKKNEHEEDKEIMRKAKQSMNRKTRPIMKYVDDSNDVLSIDRNEDNINNWEDLFDDDGQLQCDLLTDITKKVGDEVTVVRAIEDYSPYEAKPLELEHLEHVVELYAFPSSFETHDIIQTFSYIKSDAMYVKWVDDTHALLVLGSLSQAQRALEHNSPLIKARPMSSASAVALEAANKSDLKPAMKRPQTNLQTARRLITTHLGAKSRVSKEQSAKEREDLRTAKELKKLARQNERDAWEGNLRSTIKNN